MAGVPKKITEDLAAALNDFVVAVDDSVKKCVPIEDELLVGTLRRSREALESYHKHNIKATNKTAKGSSDD